MKKIEDMSDEEFRQALNYAMLPDWMKMGSDSALADAIEKELYKSDPALFNYYMTHSSNRGFENPTPYFDADQPNYPVIMQMNELERAARAAHGVTAIEEERMKSK